MRFSATEVQPITGPHGFDERIVERILYFVHMPNAINSHPLLKGKRDLKGGTQFDFQ